MASPQWSVKLEGVRQLTRALALIDPLLRKQLGQKNKVIGQRVIDNATPTPLRVGMGYGSMPRASANANILQLLAGGSHRDEHKDQWGPRWVSRDRHRPYLAASGEADMPNIERDYLEALDTVAAQAGITFRKIGL